MRFRAKAIIVFLLIVLLSGGFVPHPLRAEEGDSLIAISTIHGKIPESRTLSYITIQLDPKVPRLLSGETDSLKIEIILDTTRTSQGQKVHWDRESEAPVVAWLSVPVTCGLTFIDKTVADRSGHQTLLKFDDIKSDNSHVLTKYVGYRADCRIPTGRHFITADVVAELATENGEKVQDIGVIILPFDIDTHLRTKILTLLVVGFAIFLFVVEWVRIDVVAILMMILLPELGLLKAGDSFKGLSSNAVIAIIGVMIISYGLNRTGLVDRMIQPLLKYVKTGETRLVVVFSSMIAAISSVMQNTGAAVLFLPAIRLITSRELKIHISRVLMPIGMAAILGGTLTMIGTSPLILLNDILPKGIEKFSFLELTPIGLALVLGGIVYLATIGMKCLAKLPMNQLQIRADSPGGLQKDVVNYYSRIDGPFEISVPLNYRPGPGPQEIAVIRRRFMVNIVAISEPGGLPTIAPNPKTALHPGLGICVYGQERVVKKFVKDYGLVLKGEPELFKNTVFNPAYSGIAEMVISPRSSFIGKTIKEIGFRETFDVNSLALHQNGKIYYKELADRSLNSGDTILIQGTWEQIQSLKEHHQNFIVISSFDHEIRKPEKAKYALFSFLFALILMLVSSFYFQRSAYNPIPLSVCLMAGAITMVITRVMSISEAYKAVDWRTVFLLGGLIPLGMAVDQTGTARWIAGGIVSGLGTLMSPLVLICVLAVLSCAFSLVVSNVGALALLVPLGISVANQIGIDPRIAAIVVGIGVSNSFILPTHQVNALYMGPGEYRTKDYIRIGGGLSLVYIAILVVVAYVFYLPK